MKKAKCQVIFFPMKYIPEPREEARLQHIQDMISASRQELRWKARNEKELIALENAFFNKIRYNLEVVDGYLDFQ